MRIGKDHAGTREAIHVRRGDLTLRVEALHIAITEVVGEDEDEVRFPRGRSAGDGDEGKRNESSAKELAELLQEPGP